MSDTLQALVSANTVKANAFPITSRYFGVGTAELERAAGETTVYLRRRFVPGPERFQLFQSHRVTQGERLDNIAATYLGDPEQFWRLCDANNAMHPDELTAVAGRRLCIALPEGIVGPSL